MEHEAYSSPWIVKNKQTRSLQASILFYFLSKWSENSNWMTSIRINSRPTMAIGFGNFLRVSPGNYKIDKTELFLSCRASEWCPLFKTGIWVINDILNFYTCSFLLCSWEVTPCLSEGGVWDDCSILTSVQATSLSRCWHTGSQSGHSEFQL